MINIEPGRTPEEMHLMKEDLKTFRESYLGKWYIMNIEIWKQKLNKNQDISGERYRGIMETLMSFQLQMASRGQIEVWIDDKLNPKKEKVSIDAAFQKQVFKEKVLKS